MVLLALIFLLDVVAAMDVVECIILPCSSRSNNDLVAKLNIGDEE